MSKKYIGGLITKTPVTPAGPYQNGAASGVWTLEQAEYYIKQGIWPIAGNVELIGQQTYVGTYNTTSDALQDTYDFTVPAGVTSISAVCIGSGASGTRNDTSSQSGRAGDLRYSSNIAVTPGHVLRMYVAQGTNFATTTQYSGIASYIYNVTTSTVLLKAAGGVNINTSTNDSSAISGYIGGGNGGNGGTQNTTYAGGGGGTGGYNGNGGTGQNNAGTYATTPAAGSGAAYGGARSTVYASTGGGVNLIGLGTTATTDNGAGSYGCDGIASYGASGSGMYGAGGGGNDSASGNAAGGRPGGIRIIWGGGRTFPSNAMDYLPMSSSSFTQIELRFCQITSQDRTSTYSGAPLCEVEIYDETNTNIMRSPQVLAAVEGSNTLTFADLVNDRFGFNSSSAVSTDVQTLNSGTVEGSYFNFKKTTSSTISLFIKLSSARKIKQIKFYVPILNDWFIPYVDIYGDGVQIGHACPVPTYNSPSSGYVTSTITFT